MKKIQITTSKYCAQHPLADLNIQQLLTPDFFLQQFCEYMFFAKPKSHILMTLFSARSMFLAACCCFKLTFLHLVLNLNIFWHPFKGRMLKAPLLIPGTYISRCSKIIICSKICSIKFTLDRYCHHSSDNYILLL